MNIVTGTDSTNIEPLDIEGFIYMIECQGFYKIGMTHNLKQRISAIQSSNPFTVSLIDSFESFCMVDDESILHKYLEKYHCRGEWYKIPRRLIKDRHSWFRASAKKESLLINNYLRDVHNARIVLQFPGITRRLSQLNDQDFIELTERCQAILWEHERVELIVEIAERVAIELIESRNLNGFEECLAACREAGIVVANLVDKLIINV